MRKFLKLAAFVGLALLVASPALALDFKFGAEYRVRFYTGVGVGFNADLGVSNPRGVQLRIRPRFDVSDDNGNMTATLRLEIGDIEWGNGGGPSGAFNGQSIAPGGARVGNGSGGSIGADGVNVETKWGYVDFAMPWGVPLRLRAGLQPWFLSKGILVDDDVAGLRAYGKWNILSYDFGWYRASGGVNLTPAGNQASTSNTQDNNYDFYQAKFDAAIHSAFNPSLYFIYGRNAANDNTFAGVDPASSYYLGLNFAGKFSFMSYDLDFLMGEADGSPNGTYSGDGGLHQEKTKGWMLDGGVHFPIGPVLLHVVGSYATGDKQNGGKGEMMPYIAPSWNGAGGLYEMIGSGGIFDAVEYTQDYPGGLWMLGLVLEYRPVKAVWTKLAYGYAGFANKRNNCAYTAGGTVPTGCFGPRYTGKDYANGEGGLAGKSSLGQELSLRADWDLWTNFKVQGEAGWLFPSKGSVAAEYVLQFLYNF